MSGLIDPSNTNQLYTMKKNRMSNRIPALRATRLCMLGAAMAASASAATVGLYDFADNRGGATAENFINVGVTLADPSDSVFLVSSSTLGAAVNDTPFIIGGGLSIQVNNTAGSFTYGNSGGWNSNTNASLMADAWLFSVGTGSRTLTLSGLAATLEPNSPYRLYFMGSYSAPEATQFSDVTYDGVNLGTASTPFVTGGPDPSVAEAATMAVSFDFTTGASVADTLTFDISRADGADQAVGIQGMALVLIPEPATATLAGLAGLALAMRRRRA